MLEAELDRCRSALSEVASAHTALAEGEERFRTIAENVSEVLFLRDPISRRMIYINPAFERIWGLPATSVYESPTAFVETVLPEDQPYVLELLRQQECHGVFFRGEYRIRAADGSIRWIFARTFPVRDEQGEVTRIVGIAEDITERKAREQQQREWLYQVLERSIEGVWILDLSGTLTYVNSRMSDLLGYPQDELVGVPAARFVVDPDDLSARLAARARGLAEIREANLRRKDGSLITVRISGSPLRDEAGTCVGSLAMISDITREKRAEAQVRASLTEKETLLREIHHRVKNNLQLVSSLLSLQNRAVRDEAARAALCESRARVRSIALAHEYLHRPDSLARVRVSQYLHGLVALIACSRPHEHVAVSYVPHGDDIVLELERAVVCGLIVNELVANSLRHAFPYERLGHVEIDCRADGDGACVLEVRDDGIGIGATHIEEHPSFGLELVRALVQQLDGEMTVQTRAGTAFRVRFPI